MTATDDGVEYIRTFRAVKRTGISLTQLKRYARDGLLTIYKPSPKVSLVKWKDLVELIEGKPAEATA